MNDNNFLNWLKSIEIEEANKKFGREIKNFVEFQIEYIDDQYIIKRQKIDQYIEKIHKLLSKEKRKEIKKGKESIEIISNKLSKEKKKELDWLFKLYEIDNFYDDKNMNYNKMWKFKILYFLYAGYINIIEEINKEITSTYKSSFDNFLNSKNLNSKKTQWYAFKNGPITNHYNYLGNDLPIYINFIDEKIEEFLKSCFLILKNFSLNILINESHETKPYKDNWKESSYWEKIPNEEIINFFKENEPFYFSFFEKSKSQEQNDISKNQNQILESKTSQKNEGNF